MHGVEEVVEEVDEEEREVVGSASTALYNLRQDRASLAAR